MVEKNVNPKLGQIAPPKITLKDLKYTQINMKEIEESGLTQEQVDRFMRKAAERSVARAETYGNMGLLQNVDRVDSDMDLARKRTQNRRKNMTALEKGMWQCFRDVVTGVPPKDVRGTPDYYILDN